MKSWFLLIPFLIGSVFAKEPPDVKCMIMHLKYVECLWKTPNVNYNFYSRFYDKDFHECDTYIIEDGLNVGCKQTFDGVDLMVKRFNSFYTKLEREKLFFTKEHQLKNQVKLEPPKNITVQYRSDSNLWFEWRQNLKYCMESEVRYRVNNNNWEFSRVSAGHEDYNINQPSNTSRYELQVRSRVSDSCGQSVEWSDWSEPVVWGSHNSTDPETL